MTKTISTRALAEGALFAVITALMALIGVYIPPLSFITNLIWTLPIIILIIRNDVRVGVMATIVAGLLVFLFSNPVSAILLFLQFGGVGITYGILFKKQSSAGKTLFYGTLVALISTVVALSFSFTVTGIDLQAVKNEFHATIGSTLELYKKTGLLDKLEQSGITEEQLRKTFQASIQMAEVLLPSAVVLASMFAAFMNFIVARYILRRLSIVVPDMPPFSKWRLPWYIIWGFILGLGLLLLGHNYKLVLLGNIGKNILYIYFPLLLITGISVATYFFKNEKILPLFKGITVFLALINPPLAIMIILTIGLFDPLFDYRKLERR